MNDQSLTRQMRLEIEAATTLREQLKTLGYGDDCELIRDTIEAETNLDTLINQLIEQIAEDRAVLEGIASFTAKMKARAERIERRDDDIRDLILLALQTAEKKTQRSPLATVSRANARRKLIITSEPDIPSKWWKQSDPTLDKAGLTEHLKIRAAGISAAMDIQDEAARAAALDEVNTTCPPVTGAELSNGGEHLNVRFA